MAKKKAQHLYELLGQKTAEAQKARAAQPPAPPTVQKQEPKEAPRRFVPATSTPVMTPAPVGPGQEHVLENVITIRRDTAIVGTLLMMVLLAVAFVVGRALAPKEVSREPELRGEKQLVMVLAKYEMTPSGRKAGEDTRDYLVARGYPAELVRIGNTFELRIKGFSISDKSTSALNGLGVLSGMEIEGKKPFADAQMIEIGEKR